MDRTECTTQLELFEVSRQQVTLDYEGEGIVTDAGLLPVAKLDRELGIPRGSSQSVAGSKDAGVCHSLR
ncbi:MAG: hypothetical protein U0936_26850 [Planctomycetaceae bacterium]